MVDLVVIFLQIFLKGCQVIRLDLRKHLGDHLLLHKCAVLRLLRCLNRRAKCSHHGGHIGIFRLDRQRIIGQGVRLNLVDVLLEARG